MSTCKYPIYIITNTEDLVTRFTESKIFYDENNRGRLRAPLHLAKSEMEAIEHAKKNYDKSQWVLLVAPGHVFTGGFWEQFSELIAGRKDVGLIGHLMPDRTEPVIHNQAIAVNLQAVTLPIDIDTSFRFSLFKTLRGYPLEIYQDKEFFVEALCKNILYNNYSIINWPDSIQEHKVNFYKKEHADLEFQLDSRTIEDSQEERKQLIVNSSIGALERNKKILWIVNNRLPDQPVNVDHLIVPASGLYWLSNPSKKITVVDYNPTQLEFAQDLWNQKPNNLVDWIADWVETHDCYPNLMHEGQPSLQDLDLCVGGVELNYDKEVEFLELDVIKDYRKLFDFKQSTIWLSNIAYYEPNLLMYGVGQIEKIKSELADNQITVLDDNFGVTHGWV
jgi:hypothetical protein